MTQIAVKALVIRSPWAQEIAAGTKRIEYRSWNTSYRGWLAIVAARRPESGADAGRAVCLVKLTDCRLSDQGDFEWLLAEPVPLTKRIEIPGRLGLFDVTELMCDHLPRPKKAKPPLREIHQFLTRFKRE